MKRSGVGLAGILCIITVCSTVSAGEPLPYFDTRLDAAGLPKTNVREALTAVAGPQRVQARQQAENNLSQRIQGLRIDRHQFFGTPSFVRSTQQLLTTAPVGQRMTPRSVVKSFIAAEPALFGIAPAELDKATMTRQFVTRHNGVTHLTFQQQIGGINIHGCETKANVTARGELINVSSSMLPRPAGDFQPPAPVISPLDAIRAAAANIGTAITVAPAPLAAEQGVTRKQTWSQTPDFRTDIPITTELVYFPLTCTDIRPAWSLVLPEKGIGNTYEMIVDATNGKVLRRWNQLHFASTQPITLRVYTNDSPKPGSPGNATPNGFQFPEVPRTLLTINPIDVTAFSPDGWILDGDTDTQGNNVDAHLDLNGDNSPDLPRPNGGAGRVFDFPIDLTMAPTTYQDSVVTQLFYLNNVYHDRLYALGFDEAAGNFQVNNFGNGGVGNDRVQADAQDNFPGGSVNNANFGTGGGDGSSARMQMFIFDGPNPDIDGDLDSEIVYHEYSHGLSIRLSGGSVFGAQSGGMGEGWGDYFAIALNAEATDNPHAVYAMGGYATFQLGGLTDNYYFGIRRFPYSTDMNKNPETYADIDPGQISFPGSVPRSPIIGNTADEVHNIGEVWCMVLLECRANLWDIMGFPANDLMMQLVVDGLKLMPPGPTFLDARDAILQADMVNNGGANFNSLWAAFAKRGMGFSAVAPPDSTTSGIVEAFDLPVGLRVTPTTGLDAQGNSGGPFTPNSIVYTVDSIDNAVIGYNVTATVPWITITNGTGTVGGGATAMVTVSLNAAANALPNGRFTDLVSFVNTTDGVGNTTRSATLTIGTPSVVFTEPLDVDPGWTVAGNWAFGQPTGGGSHNGDPTSGFTGTNVFGYNLNGDYPNNLPATYLTTTAFDLTGFSAVSLQFRRWLGVESNTSFDEATVEVSNDGTNWTVVWRATSTGGDVSDSSWQLQTIDIAAVADNQPTVFIRWGMGPSDVFVTFPGWNVDDIQISAIGGTPPTGACCDDTTGLCVVTTQAGCGAGSTYQGDGTVCTPNPCPQPTGACCDDTTGACVVTTQAACGAGSTYQGDGTVCTPNPCPQPTGACCDDTTGVCVVTTQAACGAGSTYQGDGTVCTPNPCPQPTGACCDDTTGVCVVTTQAACGAGSTYQGDGTVCTPNPCPQPTGACCDDTTGACVVTTQAACGAGSTYQGDGTVCTPNPCPQPTGACCDDTTGACVVTTQAACGAGSTYQGDGTVCTPNPCPQPCALLGDMNGDTFINGGDIQGYVDAMLGVFDPCADLVAPVGVIDAADTAAFVTLLVGP